MPPPSFWRGRHNVVGGLMLERIRTIDNRILYINIDRIIVMTPQKNGTYAVRLHGRTGCVFICKAGQAVRQSSRHPL